MHRTPRPTGRDRRCPWLAALSIVTTLACAGSDPTPGANEAPQASEQGTTVGVLVTRAERAREKGDLDAAIDAYREALDRTPWNTRLQSTLAAAYAERAARTRDEQGVFGLERAERDLREAYRLGPEDSGIRHNLAVLLVDRAVREMDPERSRSLREEALSLAPEVAHEGEGGRADVERRLDLAYELIERGQVDIGIRRLETLHREHPDHVPTARLLAQALTRKAGMRSERGRHDEAGPLLDRAVEVYTELLVRVPSAKREDALTDEVRIAHHNRIVAWMNASRPDAATRALAQASEAGFEFPDLARAVEGQGPR